MHYYHSLFLINSILILVVSIQSQNSKGPGASSCIFLGGRTEVDCGLSKVLIPDIPDKCTSVIYFAVYMDLKYHATNIKSNSDFTLLDNMLKSGKRVMIYYMHETYEEWTVALACESSNGGNNSFDDVKALKGFLDDHSGIVGVILSGFQYGCDSKEIPTFSENSKKYLELMKKAFPELIIALDLRGKFLIDQYIDPQYEKLDISFIDSAMDFYVVSLEFFNDCTANLRNTGTSPINDPNTNYTLDKLYGVLQEAGFPKEKIYYKFKTTPTSIDETLTNCDVNNEKMCLQPQIACDWCSDTTLTYNEKGKFSADNGAGFMVRYIDLDDPDNCCQCATPYSAFHAMLDGFNKVETKTCNLLNRL